MTAGQTVRTAFWALSRNPLRAGLAMLGIFIGVGSVIAMMGIGNGSSAAIQRAVASMGANNLMIFPGAAKTGGVNFGMSSVMTLTPGDAEAVLKCSSLRAGSPVVRARAQVLYGRNNWVPRDTLGVTPAYLDVRDWSLAEGSAFSEADVRNDSKVCLIGKTLVRELFEGRSPIGEDVRIQNVPFKVLGVLSAKGSNMVGMDQDDVLLAPWTTVKHRIAGGGTSVTSATPNDSTGPGGYNPIYPNSSLALYPVRSDIQIADTPAAVNFTNIDMIIVAARSTSEIKPAIAQIDAVLRERHRIREGGSTDFSVRDLTEMTITMTKISDTMTLLLLCVASISLIVGGVGIMNIMLVSVTERTREIGLRMAIGARSKDVLLQFLVEAVVLCLTAGVLGIAAGLLGSRAIQQFKGWPTETSLTAIVVAVTVSTVVGVLFGFYPAWKASRLDPIEALRYE
jgi:ABC-type antimicrobial peptide transport system permease subunit